jgi:hypothetical protein
MSNLCFCFNNIIFFLHFHYGMMKRNPYILKAYTFFACVHKFIKEVKEMNRICF